MRRWYWVLLWAPALVVFLSAGTLRAVEIPIEISPNVLNISSKSRVVTVHAGIAYGDVDVTTVFLNGIAIKSWKADARGTEGFSGDSLPSSESCLPNC